MTFIPLHHSMYTLHRLSLHAKYICQSLVHFSHNHTELTDITERKTLRKPYELSDTNFNAICLVYQHILLHHVLYSTYSST
jgi:hypothetical protein